MLITTGLPSLRLLTSDSTAAAAACSPTHAQQPGCYCACSDVTLLRLSNVEEQSSEHANLENATEGHVEQDQGGDGYPDPPVGGGLVQHIWLQVEEQGDRMLQRSQGATCQCASCCATTSHRNEGNIAVQDCNRQVYR